MELRVMSFNIRTAAAPDGVLDWSHRREGVIERIRAFDPDLLGLQECQEGAQAEFIRAALGDYAFVGVPRDGGLEMAPLLYRRALFAETARGHFWLSTTPDVPGSRSWGAAYPRTLTWAALAPRAGDPAVVFANTHFDYEGTSREEAARLVGAWAVAAEEMGRLVLTGDFNAARGSATHRILTAGDALVDVLAEAGVGAGSFHDFGRLPEPEAIDWILASRACQVTRGAVDGWVGAGQAYPSDHFPVTARLSLG